jgi:two-component system response regulator VicR
VQFVAKTHSKNMKILYVEDEPFLGKIVQESLESRQFEVHWVTDGAEVLAAFESFRPDVCVLDVMLPHRDGFSLGKEIRALDPQMPIIFLTAKSQTEDVLQGFESGGNDYLRKPFSQEELIVRIKKSGELGQRNPARSGPKPRRDPLGPFFIPARTPTASYRRIAPAAAFPPRNPVARTSGHEAKHHRGATGNPQTGMGPRFHFQFRNLDVYITRLREYLKEDPGVQILTLKGVGYRVVCS